MKEKEIELKTFEIRVTNTKDQNYLKNYIYKYRHWQNILTILTINLFKIDNKDYKHFLDYAVVRACIAGTTGDKKKIETVAYIKEKSKDANIEVIIVDESYTSKTFCISGNVCDVQEYSNGKNQEESICTTNF